MDVDNIKILGGGISGLSLAYYLKKHFPEKQVCVYEKSDRLGGCVSTGDHGRFFFERGPRTFLESRCPELLELIEDVGLSDQLIFAKPQKRYIYYRGKLLSLGRMLPRAVWGAMRHDLRAPVVDGDETIDAFARRRFGAWVADYLFDPVTTGIHAGSTERLSMERCFPSLKEIERKHGSILKGMKRPGKGRLFTLKGGMGQLIKRLEQGVEVKLGCDAVKADFRTVPRPDLFAYADLVVVHLGYTQNVLKKPGFGYLIPSCYGMDVLGVVFDSNVFPEQNGTPDEVRLSVMVRPCEDPLEAALAAVKDHLGIGAFPHGWMISRWPQSTILMEMGHGERLAQLGKGDVGNYLCGPAVNACVKNARAQAQAAWLRATGAHPVCASQKG